MTRDIVEISGENIRLRAELQCMLRANGKLIGLVELLVPEVDASMDVKNMVLGVMEFCRETGAQADARLPKDTEDTEEVKE